MGESDKADIIFHLGMYFFMLSVAGIVGYEFFKLSKEFLHIIMSH
jgi:hypothetical protein